MQGHPESVRLCFILLHGNLVMQIALITPGVTTGRGGGEVCWRAVLLWAFLFLVEIIDKSLCTSVAQCSTPNNLLQNKPFKTGLMWRENKLRAIRLHVPPLRFTQISGYILKDYCDFFPACLSFTQPHKLPFFQINQEFFWRNSSEAKEDYPPIKNAVDPSLDSVLTWRTSGTQPSAEGQA